MEDLERALREHFGFDQFRPGQREVIEHILAGRHTLAVLPTGLGKSLCYQLPAQLVDGTTLVISPLIALMQDQVDALVRRGFDNVTYLNSSLTPSEIGRRYHDTERGFYKLVYIAPERCDSPRFQQLIRNTPISLVVIDEAHCISQWGHDFRPHYRTLLDRLPELKRATFLALTATATPEVQNDIIASLVLPKVERVMGDFNRHNLRFETIRADQREEKDRQLIEFLLQSDSTAIVYASTRKEAATAYQLLQSRGFKVCLYHGGLEPQQRAETQNRFLRDDCQIIVATVAFGLGIDKPNVRRVIHYNLPGSLENYYQEAGRAGRDGEPATCTLFYSQSDVRIQRFLLEQAYPAPEVLLQLYDILREAHPLAIPVGDLVTASGKPEITVNAALQLLYEQQWLLITPEGKYGISRMDPHGLKIDTRAFNQRRSKADQRLKKMITYALDGKCRRAQILNYFGQNFKPPCDGCDVCGAMAKKQSATTLQAGSQSTKNNSQLVATESSDRIARIILRTAKELHGRFGRTLITEILAGSKRKRIYEFGLDRVQNYGALHLHSREQLLSWVDDLVAQEFLKVTAEEYPCLLITSEGRKALDQSTLLALSGFTHSGSSSNEHPVSIPQVLQKENPLVVRLKQWRRKKAISLKVPPYLILHDKVIEAIAENPPRTSDELIKVKGIGTDKLAQFGAEIIGIVQDAKAEQSERE